MPGSLPHADSHTAAALDTLIERAEAKARAAGRAVLVSIAQRSPPVDVLEALDAVTSRLITRDGPGVPAGHHMYWSHPAQHFELAGFGAAETFTPTGDDRFEAVDTTWRELLEEALIEDPSGNLEGVGPTLMGGFAFDPGRPRSSRWRAFPDTLLFLPRVQVASVDGEFWITCNVVVRSSSVPGVDRANVARLREEIQSAARAGNAREKRRVMPTVELTDARPAQEWRALVGRAVTEIRAGKLEKVVLAREEKAVASRDLEITPALRHLQVAHRDCYVFGLWSGDSVFVGATPERLVRLDGRDVQTSSLAGSVRRGTTQAEDTGLAAGLRSSMKDRAEHEVVRRAIGSELAAMSDDIVADEEPSILSLQQVHHLHTAVRARLRTGFSLLDVVGRLHPSPAVGGEPRGAALAFIRDHELLDRGWYAAPIGWLQSDRGEFAVALRSALIMGREAFLFAGCGIVADSIPQEEYAESLLKLRPMELALGASTNRGRLSDEPADEDEADVRVAVTALGTDSAS
jgi:isochorismate synthase